MRLTIKQFKKIYCSKCNMRTKVDEEHYFCLVPFCIYKDKFGGKDEDTRKD